MSDINVSVTEQGTVAVTVGGEAGIAAHNADADAHAGMNTSPTVKAVRSANQSIPNATNTPIAFTAADAWDTDGFHDPSAGSPGNGRITIPTGLDGRYSFHGQVHWSTWSAGRRVAFIQKNGTDIIARNEIAPSSVASFLTIDVEAEDTAAAGDYYELYVFQNEGTAKEVIAGSAPVFLFARRLDPT